MQSGEFTSRALVELYLKRIEAIDEKGVAPSAVIELNPDAMSIAEALGAERRNGTVPGPLHGIPFLLFRAGAYQEDKLSAIAYAYEQASLRRSAPAFGSILSQARTGHELSALTTAG